MLSLSPQQTSRKYLSKKSKLVLSVFIAGILKSYSKNIYLNSWTMEVFKFLYSFPLKFYKTAHPLIIYNIVIFSYFYLKNTYLRFMTLLR